MRWFSSLRYRIVLIGLIMLLPLTAYLTWEAFEQRRTDRQRAIAHARQLSETVIETQSRVIQTTKNFLELLARLPAVRRPEPVVCGALLADIVASQPPYTTAAVIATSGEPLCSARAPPPGLNVADRAWFQRAMRTQSFAVGDYQIGRVTGKPSLGFALPVIGLDGSIGSLVYTAIDLAWLSATLNSKTLPSNVVLVMVDQNGTVVTTDESPERWAGKSVADTPLFAAIRSAAPGGVVEATGLDGVRRLMHVFAFAPSPDSEAVYAVVGFPSDEISRAADRALIRALTVSAVLGVILLLLGYWTGDRLISRPIRRLVTLSRDIGAGNLGARSGLSYGQGEIGELAASMDRMAGNIARSETVLRENQTLLRAVIDAMPASINVKDRNGRFVLVNKYLAGYYGRSVDWFAGKGLADVYPDWYGERLRVRDAKILESGEDTGRYETEYTDADDKPSMWLSSATPIRGSDGTIKYIASVCVEITEQKRIEEALRRSEERLNSIVAVMAEGLIVYDAAGAIIFANASAERILGLTADQLKGRTSLDPRWLTVHADGAPFPGETHPAAVTLRTGEPQANVIMGVHMTHGALIWITINTAPLRQSAAAPPYAVVATFHDITERRRAEQALHESEQSYRRLVERTSVMTYSFRVGEDGLSYVGPQAARILGYPLEQLSSGAFWFERMHPEDRDEVSRIGEVMEARRQDYTAEYRMFTADGCILWLRDLVAFDDDPDGTAVANGVLIDVTEQKRAEMALRESDERLRASEQRLRHLVESTDVVPYTWDLTAQKYSYIGPQVARIFGYEDKQWTDETWRLSLVHPEDRELITTHAQAFSARPGDESLEYRMVAADGRTVWVRDIVKIGSDGAGGQVGYGVMIDVTEIKFQQEQLRQAQKMEAVGQLTGGVAHDFNNLLTVVIGNLDLLRGMGRRSPAEEQRIDNAIEAARRGTELTRRLLAFSRRQVLRPTRADINAVIAGMQALLRRTLDESIDIKLALADELWPVRIDVGMLESALLNIVVNARDAMPHGGTLIIETANRVLSEDYVAQHAEEISGPYAMLAVSDTGTGMPPGVLARAFEPFFTTKEVGKGTGLGLSMVFGFVKQSGGHIAIYSEEGRGTTVRICLPRAAAGPLDAPVIPPDRTSAPTGNETILVVEDDASVRAAAIGMLRSLGYRVLDAPDGPAALPLLDQHPEVDLLLTDVVMPGGMKGPALAGAALERMPWLKVLYMSGYSGNVIVRDGILNPGVEWIGKPFERRDLGWKVREILDREPAPCTDGRDLVEEGSMNEP